MRKSRPFPLALIPALLCLIALLVACGGGQSSSSSSTQIAPPDKQVLRIPIGATDFGTLDPALVQLAVDANTVQAIWTGLVEWDHNIQLRDQLAQSHEISADGLTYTFHLRPNLKFSDGTPLTSQDVIYSIDRTLQPATKSQVAYYLNLIKDYDKITSGKIPTLIGDSLLAPDPNTVVIKISKPAAYFLQALTYPCSYVVEKKLIDKYGSKWTDHLTEGGGAGPFKVQSYDHTKGIVLVPNPNYYGPKPKIQKLEYLISGDQDTTFRAYQSHQFDYTGVIGVPPAQIDSVRNSPEFHEYVNFRIRYITMNYLVKPFDNIHIRQAFALAIDKELLQKTVFRNAVEATNHIVPKGMPGYNPNLVGPAGVSSLSGDKAKAKQLLQQGLKEEGMTSLPTITFNYYTDVQAIVQASQAIAQMWENVLGANVKLVGTTYEKLITLENATVNNPNGLQVWISGWLADYPDPQDFLSVFFDKGSGYNQMNYGQNHSTDAAKQQQVQKLLEEADVNLNQTERMQQYNQAEQQIVDDVGWIPIYQNKIQLMQSTKLHGIVYNGLSIIPPDDWANIYFTV
uniref:Peptide ABC transporter substrate-binding protein n=1 Tax=Thermogemmatispora argillosa TaxID=2045280 RepID=A0A455T0J2_9CHLR|nr:peptide ABC transporter substrate-binding protein [Thermogemmatispora argillosa]